MPPNNLEKPPGKKDPLGIAAGSASYIIWGFLPLYWKQIIGVSSLEILSHRILWGFLITLIVLKLFKGPDLLAPLREPRNRLLMIANSVLISINWGLYIYSVNVGRIVEASLGYYINPLVSILLGLLILKERLNLLQKGALILAGAGVLWMTLGYGRFPWLSLSLAFSFGLYGLFKKLAGVESLPSLAVETGILAPFALGYLIFLQGQGNLRFLHGSRINDLFILGSGVITITPSFSSGSGREGCPFQWWDFFNTSPRR